MTLDFWKNFVRSFNIFSYQELAKQSPATALKHFFVTFLLVFLVGFGFLLFLLLQYPDAISLELEKADVFNITVDFSSNEPLRFPNNDPYLLLVDSNVTEERGKVTITTEEIIVKPFFIFEKSYPIHLFGDLKKNNEENVHIFIPLLLFLLPSFFVVLFVFHFFKYLLFVVLLTVFAKLITRFRKRNIRIRKLFICGLYGITPLLIVHMVTLPLRLSLYFVPTILMIVWYIIISIELVEEF